MNKKQQKSVEEVQLRDNALQGCKVQENILFNTIKEVYGNQ